MEGINNNQNQPFVNFELGNIKKNNDQMNINSHNGEVNMMVGHHDSYNDQYADDNTETEMLSDGKKT